ncbi:MAG: helix-turn-helix transcriptional regulator [Nitrospirae bacterium]|nr:helix-turn-helix transcriptional regulator [Nitrospirota bacterium]
MQTPLFGEFFKKKRIALRKTLRQFCAENNLDPGNISKLERGLLPPPQGSEKLKEYARCLQLKKGSDDWYKFFDLAYASAGRIPEEILSNRKLLSKLPLVFRTLRGQKLTKEQLNQLAQKLKEV